VAVYTCEIVTSSTTLTFQTQPFFEPDVSYVWNDNESPPTLAAIVERWTLRDAYVASSTETDITDRWTTLLAQLAARGVTLTSVKFKRDSSTVYEMTSTTHDLRMESLKPSVVGPGTWKNHLAYTIVIAGLKRYATSTETGEDDEVYPSGIVSLERVLDLSYDSAGLLTKTLTGRVETVPGTSAEGKARLLGLESPGASFGNLTPGEGEVNVRIEDFPRDTKASFTSVWREHGKPVPSGIGEYGLAVSTREDAMGGVTRSTRVRAVGPTRAAVVAALSAQRPTAVDMADTAIDETGRAGEATFDERVVPSSSPWGALYGLSLPPEVIEVRWSVRASGGGPGADVFVVPGAPPIILPTAERPATVSESFSMRVRSANPESFAVTPLPLWSDYEDLSARDDAGWELERTDLAGSAPDYARSLSRRYVMPRSVLAAGALSGAPARLIPSAPPAETPRFGRS